MNNTNLFLVGCVAIVLGCFGLGVAIGGIYELTVSAERASASWRLNRITGDVKFCRYRSNGEALNCQEE
jgi:hypothetical protein